LRGAAAVAVDVDDPVSIDRFLDANCAESTKRCSTRSSCPMRRRRSGSCTRPSRFRDELLATLRDSASVQNASLGPG